MAGPDRYHFGSFTTKSASFSFYQAFHHAWNTSSIFSSVHVGFLMVHGPTMALLLAVQWINRLGVRRSKLPKSRYLLPRQRGRLLSLFEIQPKQVLYPIMSILTLR